MLNTRVELRKPLIVFFVCLLGPTLAPFVPLDQDPFHWRLYAGAYADCVEDDLTLCLQGDRFQIRAHWRRPDGTEGEGHGVELTGDTGYFWFFRSTNVEAVIKVLNGCPVNGHYWVYAGGLTNVETRITLLDTETGVVRLLLNPQATPFQPIQSVTIFPTCTP